MNNLLMYKEDIRYDILVSALEEAQQAVRQGKLLINTSTAAELYQASRKVDYDPLDIVAKFWRPLNMAVFRKHALDLIVLRDSVVEGRQLRDIGDGMFQVVPLEANIVDIYEAVEEIESPSQQRDVEEDVGPIDHFEGYIPPVDDTSGCRSGSTHRPTFYTSLTYVSSLDELHIAGCEILPVLQNHRLPPARTREEEADDARFALAKTKLRAAERSSSASSVSEDDTHTVATVGDFFFYVADLFQTQLLESVPVESTSGASPGDKFWLQDLPLSDYHVSANVLRESYVGLCGRLAHFSMTHSTDTEWAEQAPKYMPLPGEARPRAWKEDLTYMPIWLRFTERVSRLATIKGLQDALYKARNQFIHSFHILPSHQGKKYGGKPPGHLYTLWDDSPHDNNPPNMNSKSHVTTPPRWYTVHPEGRRRLGRIRLMYNFTHELQSSYWNYFKNPGDIRQKGTPHHSTYPCPPPFEICWLWHHSERVLAEKTYCMQREKPLGFYYPPAVVDSKRQPLGHDWWSENNDPGGFPHSKQTCFKCKRFASLNPDLLRDKSAALEPWQFNLGPYSWGIFAAS